MNNSFCESGGSNASLGNIFIGSVKKVCYFCYFLSTNGIILAHLAYKGHLLAHFGKQRHIFSTFLAHKWYGLGKNNP